MANEWTMRVTLHKNSYMFKMKEHGGGTHGGTQSAAFEPTEGGSAMPPSCIGYMGWGVLG